MLKHVDFSRFLLKQSGCLLKLKHKLNPPLLARTRLAAPPSGYMTLVFLGLNSAFNVAAHSSLDSGLFGVQFSEVMLRAHTFLSWQSPLFWWGQRVG